MIDTAVSMIEDSDEVSENVGEEEIRERSDEAITTVLSEKCKINCVVAVDYDD